MADEWLEVTQGPAAGDRLEIGRELAVGRAEPGPAGLGVDPELSRKHARFWRAVGGELIVEDLGSVNGTLVSGKRIDRPAVLAVGDTIELGGTTLVVRGEQPTRPSPPPSAQPTRSHGSPQPGSEPPSGPPAGFRAPKPRLLHLLSLLLVLLVIAVAGLGAALATRGGGPSKAVINNSTLVHPLFPITDAKFTPADGEVATFQSSSARPAVSATIDWGDGTAPTPGTIGGPIASGNGTYTRAVFGSHKYTRVATFSVTVTITAANGDLDRASNLAVVTNCFCVARKPTFAHSVDLGPVSGRVFVRPPGGASFALLTAPREIPVGSQLDATRGSLVVKARTAAGGFVGGVFDGGLFQILQSQILGGLVDLKVQGASTAGCPATNASQATQQKLGGRVLGLLHANVNGSFRTEGKFSAATVRGTEWTTAEQCDGTLTRVQRGVVDVKDFRTGRTTVVPAGQTYLARSHK
jgi:FHA domain